MEHPDAPESIPDYVRDGIERQPVDVLEDISEWIDPLIAAKVAAAEDDLQETLEDDETDVLEEPDEDGVGAVYLSKKSCGKDECTKCPHGPYQYRSERHGGTVESVYVGKP